MTAEVEAGVARHYASADLTGRILSALAKAGLDIEKLTADQLFHFDQMHGRQLSATREHVGRLALDASKHVLDVGSGIGGPARYMAFTYGCRVTGTDLTESFVATARDLTARCGLEGLVTFERGNALAMPFATATFDAAACQYVAMNIPDKGALLREIARVLKPGGRLVFSSVVARSGAPPYPLPWAREASVSFLIPAEAHRPLFEEAGLSILEWTDETEILRCASGSPPPPTSAEMRKLVSGDDFTERSRNFGAGIADGSLGSILVVAERK